MKILVIGSFGMLGNEIARQLGKKESVDLYAWDVGDLDITDFPLTEEKISNLMPKVIFNCAAYNFVDKAEDERELAMKINFKAVENLAKVAEKIGAIFVHYSTGYVFNGEKGGAYAEDEKLDPQSVYARSKFLGEKAALEFCRKTYLIRLNQLFGKSGAGAASKKGFVDMVLELASSGKKELDFVSDEISTRAYAPDLAKASIELVFGKYPFGIYHLTNEGQASWHEWASEILKIKGVENVKINKVSAGAFVRKAARPKNSSLANTKFPKQRKWQDALKEYIMEQE